MQDDSRLETKAIRYSASGNEIEIEGKVLQAQSADPAQTKWNRFFREDYLNKLSPLEMSSKIEAWKTATWDEGNLADHVIKRGMTTAALDALSKSILQSPESVIAYGHKGESDRIGYVKKVNGRKYFVAVDPYSGKITTCFAPTRPDYIDQYMRVE